MAQTLFDDWVWKKLKNTTRTSYNYMGKKNTEHFKKFKDICRLTQMELKAYLEDVLATYYEEVYSDDGFLYVKGTNSNVLLTAHMDTVHEPAGRICTDIYEYHDKKNKKHILSSPQGIGGDDRCGIYTILKVLERTEFRPYIIFCEDEEIGGVGSKKFCKTTLVDEVGKEVNFMIEIDRAHANDAVFYEETNAKFQRFVTDTTGTEEAFGSFSDICNLSEETMVSSFNISCGYYNAHTTDEYVVMEELEDCIGKVIKLIEADKKDEQRFEYEPDTFYRSGNGYNYGYGYYGYGYGNSKNSTECEVEFTWYDKKTGNEESDITYGTSLEECIGQFLLLHSDLCWNDVIDYDEYDFSSKKYKYF